MKNIIIGSLNGLLNWCIGFYLYKILYVLIYETVNINNYVYTFLIFLIILTLYFIFIYYLKSNFYSENIIKNKITDVNFNNNSIDISFEIKIQKAEILEFMKIINIQNNHRNFLMYIFNITILFQIMYSILFLLFSTDTSLDISIRIGILLLFIIIYFYNSLFWHNKWRSDYFLNEFKLGKVKFQLNNLGIRISGELYENFYSWNIILILIEKKYTFYLFTSNGEGLFLPMKDLSEFEQVRLKSFFENRFG